MRLAQRCVVFARGMSRWLAGEYGAWHPALVRWDLENLASVLDESTVLDVAVDEAGGEVRFRLGVLAHPAPGSHAQPEVTIVLGGVRRLAGWLRKIDRIPDPAQGENVVKVHDVEPPVVVQDVQALNGWFELFRGVMYAQPEPMFDRSDQPSWLVAPSFDLRRGPSVGHTVDMWFDANSAAGNHRLDVRVWFRQLHIFDPSGREMTLERLTGMVSDWWTDMREGRIRGQYGIVPGSPS